MQTDAIDYAALFALTPTPLMMLDRQLCYVTANASYLQVTGRRLEDLVGRYIFDAFPENGERLENLKASFERALEGHHDRVEKIAYAITRGDGSHREMWWTAEHIPVRDRAGAVIGLMQNTVDVSAEVAAERMREAITIEYDHRVRNILTKVSAIARRTARSTTSTQKFIEDFDPRIAAMARAHKLLVHGGWEQLGLADLVAAELEPYAAGSDGQVNAAGPNVLLSSRAAQAFGMAVHELATNAVKYGALKHPEGRLDVGWSVDADGALHFVWTESGLSDVAAPAASGFGSTIIDQILPAETGGTVSRRFAASGLVCTVDVPVPA